MQKVFRFIVLLSYSIHSQHAFATIDEAVREAIHEVVLSNKFIKIFSEYKKENFLKQLSQGYVALNKFEAILQKISP